MVRVLEELCDRYYVLVEYVDITNNQEIAAKYHLRYTPMLIMFDKNEHEVAANVGKLSIDEIVEIFASHNIELLAK